MADHMTRLIEMGSTGLDLSPGCPTAAWAAETITELRARIAKSDADRGRAICESKELEDLWISREKKLTQDNLRLTADNQRLQSELDTNRNARNVLYAENQRLRADGERDRERLVNAIFANVDRETYAMIMRDENEVEPRSVDSARGN